MQSSLIITFSVITACVMLILVGLMYIGFSISSQNDTIQNTKTLLNQTGKSVEDYLYSMRRVSDTIYYNVVKEQDFWNDESEIQKGMNLLYEGSSDNVHSVAIYNGSGSLMAAEPVALQKEDPNVTKQDWFIQSVAEMENMHFSLPHIQNLFDDGTRHYYWVISLSRMVELNVNGNPEIGVLLVDMDYSKISHIMDQLDAKKNGQYYYLCDQNGEIIYHPKVMQINEGLYNENSSVVGDYKEGINHENFGNKDRTIIVDTISYTGWKLVGVIPDAAFSQGMLGMRYFIGILVFLLLMMLIALNRIVSLRLSGPIMKLSNSVRQHEAGEKPQIAIGGALEIRQLGHTIQRSYEQIDMLMKEIVVEQNERRKSELDALQSQINPHFLYNTLESITWMIEGQKNDEAVFMISQLAKLLRFSLSKGHTVISVRNELQQAQSYMNIQAVRYKNVFSVEYDIEESVYDCCIVKLVLQPLLENAIAYGISEMDESGEIHIKGSVKNGIAELAVIDNGMGMEKEVAELVLTDSNRVHKHGSGVGLVNVNNRIHLLFGKEYGVHIESELDEGTTVAIRFPAIPYTEENREFIEQGYWLRKEEITNREMQDVKEKKE